ncbi:MAG: hypothetical protein LBH57_00180 [Treponema sp.]|nr:hypothetical protein [Treponema sp.]
MGGLTGKKEFSTKQFLCGTGRRSAAEKEGNNQNVKKFQREVMMKAILPERYFAERPGEQDKKNEKKKLFPEPVKPGPVLGRGPSENQKTF